MAGRLAQLERPRGRLNLSGSSPSPKTQGLLNEARVAQEEARKANSKKGLLKQTGKETYNTLTTSEQRFGQSIGDALYAGKAAKQLEEEAKQKEAQTNLLIAQMKANREKGKSNDTLINSAKNWQPITNLEEITPSVTKTNRQILGEGLGVGLDLATTGVLQKGAKTFGLLSKANQAVKATTPLGILKNTLKSTAVGAGVGYGYDVSNKLQNDVQGKEVFKPGLGTLIGGGLPLAIGGAQMVQEGRKLYQSMTPAQRQAGFAKFIPASEEFKVGDVLDPQGKTNMVGRVTIREVKGNTLKFVDSEGTEFAGMQRSTVRDLVKGGSWKKVNQPDLQNRVSGKPAEKGGLLGEASRTKQSLAESKQPILPQTPKAGQVSSLVQDTKTLANSQVNVDNLNISKEGKRIVEQTVDEVRPTIEKFVGTKLSNKEALNLADNSARMIRSVVDRQTTLNWEAAMLKARQKLSASAESGVVDKDFIEALMTVKTHGTDIARKLQSLSIGSDPKNITSKQAILDAILQTTDNADEIIKAAKGVDFNDLKQATDFYRKFIKPKAGEWIDLLRYNSMLSSPKTHIVNTISNLINTIIVAPIEKTVTGGLDFMSYPFKGKREAFAGEGAVYLKNYFNNIGEAANRFGEVMKGQRTYTNLDTKNIPIATSGLKGKVVSTLSVPMRLLEASDQFFTALAESGERGALNYRVGKGVKVGLLETKVADNAAYRLFRQELHSPNQGHVLDAIDSFTSMLYEARNSKNPIVSNVSKFTVPFLRTPMNIFKQGIEYSPAGISTLIGAKNKTEQLSKAIIGSAVFMGASTVLSSNRLTWGEPISEKEKNAFRAAGKQPYSIKVGDNWVSYQKLPPALAFPFAMVASIDDLLKNKKTTDDTADLILTGIAKYGSFLADQSYARSIGDLLTAVKGGESGISRVISNYPQQLIPFKGLAGWINRFFDNVQRKVNPDASFIDKQTQQLMMSIPGLSQNVPARLDYKGEPIPYSNPTLNAFSPFNVTTENPKGAKIYEGILEEKQLNKEKQARRADFKTNTYDEVQEILKSNPAEADKMVQSLTKEEQELYKDIRTSERSKNTANLHDLLKQDPTEAVRFVRGQNEREKARLVERLNDKDSFTDGERALYVEGKSAIITQ